MQNEAKGWILGRNLNKSVCFLLYSLSTKKFLTMKTPSLHHDLFLQWYYITKTQKPQVLWKESRYRFEPYSLRAAKPAALVLRASLRTTQRSRSNFARLADERAHRLGFAALSAPPRFARRCGGENPFFSAKKKDTECPKGHSVSLANNCNFDTILVFRVCFFWIYNPTNYINNKRNNIDC